MCTITQNTWYIMHVLISKSNSCLLNYFLYLQSFRILDKSVRKKNNLRFVFLYLQTLDIICLQRSKFMKIIKTVTHIKRVTYYDSLS